LIINWVLPVHVAAGAIALFVFWVPLVTVKGGVSHRRAGWVFVTAMAVAALTAWVICGIWFVESTRVQRRANAAFLAFVGLLALNTSWHGLRALRFKGRKARHRQLLDIGMPLLLVLAGLAIVVYGIEVNNPLLMGFAPVGIIIGTLNLAYWLRPPRERMHWWYEHMAGMIGTCIATITAFLVVNSVVLGFRSPYQLLAVFLAPTLVGVPGLLFWQRYYRKRFEHPAASQEPDPDGPKS
jgi:hypothetical protein